MIRKYRKKPVVIEALAYDGANHDQINDFTGGQSLPPVTSDDNFGTPLIIPTLEGDHYAQPGDLIIKGVAGEFYPCKPEIFAETYEPVPEEAGGNNE